MLGSDKSPYYECGSQHLERHHDHLDTHARVSTLEHVSPSESNSVRFIHRRNFHSQSPFLHLHPQHLPKSITTTNPSPQIICAILNKYYSFTQPFGSDWTFWYMRESSTALIAANLPLTWPIFQRVFNLKSFLDNSPSNRSGSNGRYTTFSSRLRSRGRSAEDEDHNLDRSRHRSIRDTLSSAIDRSESEERIYTTTVPLKIYQKREVEISTLPAGPDDTKDRLRRKSSTETLPDGLKTVVNVMGGGERSSSKSRKYDESTSEKSVGGLL